MTVIAILELTFKPEMVEEARELFRSILVDTRAFAGCESIEVLIAEADETQWAVIEHWASPEHHAAYQQWRGGEGATPRMADLVAARPHTTRYVTTDI
jgi:quinol monooxygenase YgiN